MDMRGVVAYYCILNEDKKSELFLIHFCSSLIQIYTDEYLIF